MSHFSYVSIPNTPMFYYSLQCVSNSIGAHWRFCKMFARSDRYQGQYAERTSIYPGWIVVIKRPLVYVLRQTH